MAQVLGPNGRLSTAMPGFVARQEQVHLATAIERVIQQQTTLVAEAGTGTGKTFAYLIPCLLSGKKAIISTATKTLQDQLFQKDLPALMNALGLSVRVQNLKGRSNYICKYRTALHAETGYFTDPVCAHDVLHVREKLPQLTLGERAELPLLSEESPAWGYVTSTADNCLGHECSEYSECFLMKARKRALEADIVVINHHLFFADSRLKKDGFAELLPGVSMVVFDEAHQLAEIATHFYGDRVSTRQLRDLMEDILREWPVLDLANQPLKQYRLNLDTCVDALLLALERSPDRIEWNGIVNQASFKQAWQNLLLWHEQLLECFASLSLEDEPGAARCKIRLEMFLNGLKTFVGPQSKYIRWLERFKNTIVFHLTPFNVKDEFQALLSAQSCAYVMTSATLTMADSFDCFIGSLGLNSAETLLLPSPFDFKQQALLYLPRDLPDPNAVNYHECLVNKVVPIIEACAGRCFFLFTSHRALKLVASMLKSRVNYPLLIQGDEAKPILLARFRALGNAVLLGTATFWEGVDVKGDTLSCVIIDKLPFASPADPITRGKMSYLKSQGISGFDALSLPQAVLALKQGVGRLIRDVTDRGVLMIADPRLTGRAYGKFIFDSLPVMQKTREEHRVLTFISELATTAL